MSFLNQSIYYLSSFAAIGALVAASFLIVNIEGALTSSALQIKKRAILFFNIWLVSAALKILLTLADILDGSISSAIQISTLNSFLRQTDLGRALLIQLIAIALIAIALNFFKRALPIAVITGLSLITIVIPVFQSHAAASGSHALAIGALVTHVIALSLWVGSLFAIVLIPEEQRIVAVQRFSQLALWAAIAVAISGIATAYTRLNFKAAWGSQYSTLVIVKVAMTLVLLMLARINRQHLQSGDEMRWKELLRLISVEVMVMAAVVVMGSWLTLITPPVTSTTELTPAQLIVGMKTPPPPTLWRILISFSPDALMISLLVTAAALYFYGVHILRKRGDAWPKGRTAAFISGLLLIDLATSGGLGLYALFSFQYHMLAHMILGMIAPIGLVLGAPITLALRTLPAGRTATERGPRAFLLTTLHSRYSLVLNNPITALAIFDGSLFALYFTNLFGNLMQNHVGHLLMNIHFIAAGFLFFHVIIGVDPNPRKVPHIVRIVILFAAMSLHAFFSVALMSATTLIDRGYYASLNTYWLGDLLADQRAGGTIGWAVGEIPILIALTATFILWMREDKRETIRIDRNEARMAAMGEADELAQYNAYLARLQQRDGDKK